mmetsp:Transcript_11550/g.16053  ORF Transcript_11550/g.16053 Transcript_11550/m.16053 type:complete len:465 (+) Transcript_11550:183-1577(+)
MTSEAPLDVAVAKDHPTGLHQRHAQSSAAQFKDIEFKNRPSLLSSDSSTSKNYRGILNLAILLLIITNARLVIVNGIKYGILLNFEIFSVHDWHHWPGVMIACTLHIFILATYFIEKFAATNKLTNEKAQQYHLINLVCEVLIPCLLVWFVQPNPASGIIVMLFTTVIFAKLYSYYEVNKDLRELAGKEDPSQKDTPINDSEKQTGITYPNNVTLKNMYYFICVPTLCYKLEYPRANTIRVGYLIRRILEAGFFSFLILAIVEQYIIPLVHNSLIPLNTIDLLRITERLLKLALPNLCVWLLGFYVFFHLYLNILAEITMFGDRLFYRDWWNSTNLSYFWRHWNLPVHTWIYAHVFTPVMKKGYSKNTAIFMCFFVSAFFHEVILGVPFQMLKLWAFAGMMAQLPAIILTEPLRGHQFGNVMFWFSIVLGQPFLVLMVYRDWYQRHYADLITADTSSAATLQFY